MGLVSRASDQQWLLWRPGYFGAVSTWQVDTVEWGITNFLKIDKMYFCNIKSKANKTIVKNYLYFAPPPSEMSVVLGTGYPL